MEPINCNHHWAVTLYGRECTICGTFEPVQLETLIYLDDVDFELGYLVGIDEESPLFDFYQD